MHQQNPPSAPPAAKARQPWRAEYPFMSHWLDCDGPRMHYLDEGRGETILAAHGNPTWSFYWRRLVSGLADHCRLVVPDHVGCGLSAKPQRYPYRLAQHVENLLRLVRSLDLRQITLVAHDWGGAIGLGAAVREPERFVRIVLLNTAAFRSNWAPLRIRTCRIPGLGTLAVRGLNAFSRAALHMAVEKPLSAIARAGYLAPYDSWRNRVAVNAFVKDIPLSPRHASYGTLAEIEAGLPKLADRPLGLVWGMKDWCFTPDFLRRFQEIFPHAETLPLEDAGHYVMEDAGERVVAWIGDFLRRHPLGGGTPGADHAK